VREINELKNLETGKCVLIAGGSSVNDFDFSNLDSKITRIAVNRCFVDTRIDYQIFCDGFFLEWIDKHPIEDGRVLIGPILSEHKRVDYYYSFLRGISEGRHTGYVALQIAELLGFDEIYLVGYDYYEDENGLLHYYEGRFDTEITPAEKNGIRRLLKNWIDDFDRHRWSAKIYNCNPKSKLKKFPFKEVI